ncbi:MAG: CocE/NonD family hydrolase [Bacteroidota bacterium]
MNRILLSVFVYFCLSAVLPLFGQIASEPFEFQFEEKTLRGLIEKPQNKTPKAIVLIIPGYGRTNFVEGKWSYKLRENLVDAGLTVILWDKMGCGKSDGTFNAQQPVENSAQEAIAAIQEIKKRQVPGHEKIGLWGLSRAGWICPLINKKFPVDFWISVSGTNDKENFGYLLESNLRIAGKSESEVERLSAAWKKGHQLYCNQADYETFLAAIQPLRQDSLCRQLFGYTNKAEITEEDRKNHQFEQQSYTSKGHFDEASGLWVYIQNFDTLLLDFKCPVLAIFGQNDSQVDWKKTKQLYKETIGQNPNTSLKIETFEQCNHSLRKCITCAFQEDLSSLSWQHCDGYFETMKQWLSDHGMVQSSVEKK